MRKLISLLAVLALTQSAWAGEFTSIGSRTQGHGEACEPIAGVIRCNKAVTINGSLTTTGAIELGNASDTTISRSAAGEVQVEGVDLVEVNDSPTLGTITTTGNIELGNASDTTLARSGAGAATLEGSQIVTAGNAAQQVNQYTCFKISDETTAITTGTSKIVFYFPVAWTVSTVYAGLSAQSTSGAPAFDINEAGVSILSTTLTIDANEDTSGTAATAAVISDSSIAANAKMSVDIDTAGTGAKGAQICIGGHPT